MGIRKRRKRTTENLVQSRDTESERLPKIPLPDNDSKNVKITGDPTFDDLTNTDEFVGEPPEGKSSDVKGIDEESSSGSSLKMQENDLHPESLEVSGRIDGSFESDGKKEVHEKKKRWYLKLFPGRRKRKMDTDTSSAPPRKKWLTGLVRDVIISVVIVATLLLSLYLYSGVWPPMVVIESNSMMHGDDSQIGVIDTGDLTLVKKVNDRKDIVTYVEATCSTNPRHDYRTYGEYGDVIVYRKNGMSDTPVIHRAIAWIEFNMSASQGGRYRGDIPDIGVYNCETHTIVINSYDTNIIQKPLTIRISYILKITADQSRTGTAHGGFVTKGDHNPPQVDQELLRANTGLVEPVMLDWIVGKAQGELPWFGLFKLWITGHNTNSFPRSSVQGLIITVCLLIIVPIIIDIMISKIRKKREKNKETRKNIREFD